VTLSAVADTLPTGNSAAFEAVRLGSCYCACCVACVTCCAAVSARAPIMSYTDDRLPDHPAGLVGTRPSFTA